MNKKNKQYPKKDQNQIRQTIKIEAYARGFFSILIGLFFLVLGIGDFRDSFNAGFFMFTAILCLVFVVAGILFLRKPEKMDQREYDLSDPENKKNQTDELIRQKRREKYLKYSKKYKNLQYLFFAKHAWTWTQVLIIMAFVSLFALIFISALEIKFLYIVYILAAALVLWCFYINYNKKSRDMLFAQYKSFGLEKKEAKADFEESKFYTISTEFVYVSSRFIYDSQSGLLLPVSDIVLVFPGFDRQVTQKIVSKVEVAHYLVICFENGKIHKLMCPEEIGPVLEEDIVNAGNAVTTGYSYELFSQYMLAPNKFRSEPKLLEHVTQMPVGPDILNNKEAYEERKVNEYSKAQNPQGNNSPETISAASCIKNLFEEEQLLDEKLACRQAPQEYRDRYKTFKKSMEKSYKIQSILFGLSGAIIVFLWLVLCILDCSKTVSTIMLILLAVDIIFKFFTVKLHLNIALLPSFSIYAKKEVKLSLEGKSLMELPEVHDKMELIYPNNMLEKDLWQCNNIIIDRYYDAENLYLVDLLRTMKIPFSSIREISPEPVRGRIKYQYRDIENEKDAVPVFLKPDNVPVLFYNVKVLIDSEIYAMCIPESELDTFCRITNVPNPKNGSDLNNIMNEIK